MLKNRYKKREETIMDKQRVENEDVPEIETKSN